MTDRFYKIFGMWTLAFMVFLILPMLLFAPEVRLSGVKIFAIELGFGVFSFYYDKFIPEGSVKW